MGKTKNRSKETSTSTEYEALLNRLKRATEQSKFDEILIEICQALKKRPDRKVSEVHNAYVRLSEICDRNDPGLKSPMCLVEITISKRYTRPSNITSDAFMSTITTSYQRRLQNCGNSYHTFAN